MTKKVISKPVIKNRNAQNKFSTFRNLVGELLNKNSLKFMLIKLIFIEFQESRDTRLKRAGTTNIGMRRTRSRKAGSVRWLSTRSAGNATSTDTSNWTGKMSYWSQIHLKPLKLIRFHCSHLLIIVKVISYCYHLVKVIRVNKSHRDHIKLLPL